MEVLFEAVETLGEYRRIHEATQGIVPLADEV